jgi:NAD(P)-dependent dehydrogenase (short-subunit alcohol dehydrogenase family)
MDKSLKGRVAWVTGATSGIGREVALELARRGAIVAVSGRRRDRLERVVAEGGRLFAVPCDVRDEASLAAAVDDIVARHGRLDLALANAGFSVGGRIEELNADDWRRQLETNVIGAALTARAALPALRITRGRLGLVGSVAAFLPAPSFAPYHASKYALRALGLTLSAELAGSGVSCTTVHPGFVASEITQVDNHGRHDPSRADQRPAALMWPTDRAARVIVSALLARRREVVFTAHGRAAAFLGMHFPALAHLVMTRGAMKQRADAFRVEP